MHRNGQLLKWRFEKRDIEKYSLHWNHLMSERKEGGIAMTDLPSVHPSEISFYHGIPFFWLFNAILLRGSQIMMKSLQLDTSFLNIAPGREIKKWTRNIKKWRDACECLAIKILLLEAAVAVSAVVFTRPWEQPPKRQRINNFAAMFLHPTLFIYWLSHRVSHP